MFKKSFCPMVLLVGCGFTPESGTYVIDSQSVTSDECGFYGDDDPPDEPFELVYDDEAETVVFSEGFDPCALDGNDFDCVVAEIIGGTPTAELTQIVGAAGAFDSATSFSMDVTFDGDCAGADCGTLPGPFPCTTALSVSASIP